MSAKQMGAVWDLDLPHNEAWVLLALADHADHMGENTHPGVDLLAYKTGYTERQVQRILRRLEDKRVISIEAHGRGGRGHFTTYTLHVEKGVKKSPFERKARKGDTTTSPINGLNGDIVSPIPELKGDISEIKGDISAQNNGHKPATVAALEPQNRLIRTVNTTKESFDLAALCDQIAEAAHLETTHENLCKLVTRHQTLGDDGLVFEAAKAAEWIADHRGRKMTLRFLDNWLDKAEHPRPQQQPAVIVNMPARREAPAPPDGRKSSITDRPAALKG